MEMDLILSRDSITTPVKKKKKKKQQSSSFSSIFVMLALTQTAIAYPSVKKGNTTRLEFQLTR
jgi:hypothetical protein